MELKILIRGAGDLATGIACRLFKSGMKVVATELSRPLVIRRTAAFASAIFEGEIIIEEVKARLVDKLSGNFTDYIPIIIDPHCEILKTFIPHVLVDARMMKHNPDTDINMAPLVIALGPGYEAGVHVHKVIETMRGHYLGRIIEKGYAMTDTGTPGELGGETAKRIIRAPLDGIFQAGKEIGDHVSEGEMIGKIENLDIKSSLSGILRGLIKDGHYVHKGLKIGDVDPRCKPEYIYTISDKARALGGSVLEAILSEFSDRLIFK